MTETVFMTAQEVADCLGTSKAFVVLRQEKGLIK